MTLSYAGIGSRETPEAVQRRMTALAAHLANLDYILRTGGADGADNAFKKGCDAHDGDLELYLPWKGFNGHKSGFLPSLPAFAMAKHYHPAWEAMSQGGRSLHARNCHQVLGAMLNDPVRFIICWTKDGKASGGTGQALRIAMDPIYNIKIFNLHDSTLTDKDILDYAQAA